MDQHGLNECPRCGASTSTGATGHLICGHCGFGWAPSPAEIAPTRLPAPREPQDRHPDERLGADDLTNLALADDRLHGRLLAERWPERGKR